MPTQLLNVDCMEYMKNCGDNAFDLAIVDPPYGIDAGKMTMGSGKHNFVGGKKDWDSKAPGADYFAELFRTSKNQIIWGGNYFTKHLPPTPHWIVWDKINPNLSFAEGELAWVNNGKNLRIYAQYSAQTGDGPKMHPTQKPIKLYKYLLKNYANPGQRIIDTHLGSGSSAVAAHYFGCDFVGLEIDKDYFDAAQARFKKATAQLAMF